jgi:hypothetical protein
MLRGMKMFCGVFVLRGVAAADVAASQAKTQMYPTVAHLKALFAAFGLGFDAFDLIEMRTSIGHCGSLSLIHTVMRTGRITLRLESECEPENACRLARK